MLYYFFVVNTWFHFLLQVVVAAASCYFFELHCHQIILFEVSFSYLFRIISKKNVVISIKTVC